MEIDAIKIHHDLACFMVRLGFYNSWEIDRTTKTVVGV